jgi:HlyD family secretion protein
MTDFAIRDRLSQRQAVSRHLRTSLVLSALLGGGLVVWASTAQITGAVIAPGTLVVDTSV